MANCNPPYARGTGGWCGCSCGCCPPEHCTGNIRWRFTLSTSSSSSSSGTTGDCDCNNCPSTWEITLSGFGDGCASSSAACSCEVIVTLTYECKIEITNGIAYSIGSQNISYTLNDECDSIAGVLINDAVPPVFVADGEEITVTVVPLDGYSLCTQNGPACEYTLFHMAMTKTGIKLVPSQYMLSRLRKK